MVRFVSARGHFVGVKSEYKGDRTRYWETSQKICSGNRGSRPPGQSHKGQKIFGTCLAGAIERI